MIMRTGLPRIGLRGCVRRIQRGGKQREQQGQGCGFRRLGPSLYLRAASLYSAGFRRP